ncbi:filamin-binding LIM protein 1-like isoform X2 [Rhincodon typus]|uniref:filamin-binding LIM protein 1-like isoform X2 n=1 Tax=Rhincodon typus TaxID=259920 RepID=UPI00202EC7CF|nr:filamin-binding LIM protein 1-like isoform X2 [Rhincodon typus]
MSPMKKVSSVYIQLATPGRISTPKTYNSFEASRADKHLLQKPVPTAPKSVSYPYSYGNKGTKGTIPSAYNSADEDFPPLPPPPAPEKTKDAFHSNEMPFPPPPPPLQACEEPVPSLTDSKQSRLLKSNVGASPKQQEFSMPSKPARFEQKDFLTQTVNDKLNGLPDSEQDICAFCNQLIPTMTPAVEAMGKIFHEDCLKCRKCQCKLVGKTYFNLDDNPHCDSCYRDTLEKCEKCRKPIMDQFTKAMDKAFHSECFRCVVCNRLIGSERFGVNQEKEIYCLEDFQRRYAPQCSVCEKPIIPETAREECLNIELFGRHFHVNCYRCEKCGRLLSPDATEEGCFPLNKHILCKTCHMQSTSSTT